MGSRKLSPSDLQQLLDALAPRVARLVVAAKSQGYMPPFKLLITDAHEDVLLHLAVNGDGAVQDFTVDTPVKARAPLAIVLTDQMGNVWTWKFEKPTRSCIQ